MTIDQAAETALLRWLDTQDPDAWSRIDEVQTAACPDLSEAEFRRVVQFLRGNELIKGPVNEPLSEMPYFVRIATRGQNCVRLTGGDVTKFLKSSDTDRSVNIGSISGSVVVGDQNTVSQTVVSGVDFDAVLRLCQVVSAALPGQAVEEGAVRAELAELVEAAQRQDAQGVLSRFGRFSEALADLTPLALNSVVSSMIEAFTQA